MMQPRSFLFTRKDVPSTPKRNDTSYDDLKVARKESARPKYRSRETSPTAPKVTTMASPTTSEPVVIPVRSHREVSRDSMRNTERKERRQNGGKQAQRRTNDVHSPNAIPPAVAALLAMTAIPPQKSKSSLRLSNMSQQRLTVDDILRHTRVSEKELSMSFGKNPMDVLLSPPEESEDDVTTGSELGMESYLSSRTLSTDSVPSLDDDSIREPSLSPGYPFTPSSRGKRSIPTRRLQSLPSPPGETSTDHPLSDIGFDVDELDFRVYGDSTRMGVQEDVTPVFLPQRKSAFKSNLTASLRALRDAAISISSMTTPMITPDDFLTRSIISIDPRVPFTDERMPPRLEDIPTPALRRYLNPTTNAPIEAHVPSSLAQTTRTYKVTASIQMQTYKVSKASSVQNPPSVISRRTTTVTPDEVFAEVAAGPVARQRDMRENSDFIRVAVMEMMMRKNGKLDEKMPGRAKWALPPRQPSTKVYEIGEGGVPVRWIATSIGSI